MLDEPEQAITLLEESSLLLQSKGNGAQTYFFRGIALLRLGRPSEGVAMLRASLPLMQETGSDFFTGTVVGTCASVLARPAPAAAAELLGALERLRAESGVSGAPNDVEVQERTRARLERSMDAAELAAAWARGAELSMDEAAELAYAELGKLAQHRMRSSPRREGSATHVRSGEMLGDGGRGVVAAGHALLHVVEPGMELR